MMDKLGEFSLNQKEYDKWMILKDFDKNPESIDDNEGKYPDLSDLFRYTCIVSDQSFSTYQTSMTFEL